MPGTNQAINASEERREDYWARQQAVADKFRAMPRGSQARCAFAIQIAPTTISQVVLGHRMSLPTLMRIEDWLSDQAAPAAKKTTRRAAKRGARHAANRA